MQSIIHSRFLRVYLALLAGSGIADILLGMSMGLAQVIVVMMIAAVAASVQHVVAR